MQKFDSGLRKSAQKVHSCCLLKNYKIIWKKCSKTQFSSQKLKHFKYCLHLSLLGLLEHHLQWHPWDILVCALGDPIFQTSVKGVSWFPRECVDSLALNSHGFNIFFQFRHLCRSAHSYHSFTLSISGTETFFYNLLPVAIKHHDRHYLIRQVDFLDCPQTPPSHQLWLLWVRAGHTNIQILILAGTPSMSCKATSGLSHHIKCHFTNLTALPEVKWLFIWCPWVQESFSVPFLKYESPLLPI